MPTEDDKRVRPSEEIKNVADYFLAAPPLNVAIQQGGLQLGKIASHIVTSYFTTRAQITKLDANGKEVEDLRALNSKQRKRYAAFKFFTLIKLPMIAAALGVNITDDLLAAYRETTKQSLILASGLKTDYSAVIKEATAPAT